METKIEIGSWRDNEMNIKDFKWTREPDDYTLTDDKIEIITQPGTDCYTTYYKILLVPAVLRGCRVR